MRNITCDSKINDKECRSKISLAWGFSGIPDDWVEIRIFVVGSTTIAKTFCPKCADILYIDKNTLSQIKDVDIESNFETVLSGIIEEMVQDSLSDLQS